MSWTRYFFDENSGTKNTRANSTPIFAIGIPAALTAARSIARREWILSALCEASELSLASDGHQLQRSWLCVSSFRSRRDRLTRKAPQITSTESDNLGAGASIL
jgi:hypothetical protein